MKKKTPNGLGSIRKKVVNGKTYFEGRFTDPATGRRCSTSGKTESECRAKLQQAITAAASGRLVEPNKITVAEWIDRWLSERNSIAATTAANYRKHFENYIRPEIGSIHVQSLHRSHCQTLVNALTGAPGRKGTLQPRTIRNAVSVLSSALDEAVKQGIIATNPAAHLDLPRIEKKPPRVLDEDHQSALVNALSESRFGKLYFVMLHTGVRISEALGLQWKNIDLVNGCMTVTGQLSRKDGADTERTLTATKTNKYRAIPLPPFLCAAFKEIDIQQKTAKMKAGSEWGNSLGLVFTDDLGNPISHSSVEKDFKRTCERAGLDNVSPHALRHTDITNRIRRGDDLKTVSGIAGHSTISTTADIYAGITNSMLQASAARAQEEYESRKA